ncbi:MAG: hypothetical protein ACFCU7_10730 [Pleurocapsa sp.]
MTNNNSSQSIPDLADLPLPIWQQPEIIRWSQILAHSYRQSIE